MREAVRDVDMDAVWKAHNPANKVCPPCSVQGSARHHDRPVVTDTRSGGSGSSWSGAGVVPLPRRLAVYQALVRHGLVPARAAGGFRPWERPRAMNLWQMDVMGRVFLASGAEVKIVAGIDEHSRVVVCAQAVMRALTARPVSQALTVALRRYGIPAQILTDSGKEFTNWFRGGAARLGYVRPDLPG